MNKVALITGASGGLGLQFAYIHASKGDNVILVARNKEKMLYLRRELIAKYGVTVYIIEKDLSHKRAAKDIYDDLHAKNIKIDYLINNAGFGDYGFFVKMDEKTMLDMLSVNIVTLTYLTRLFLPEMVNTRCGKILNVASTAAFQPGPTMAVYFATKSYVLSFTEALANELKGKCVTATALCPGPTDTDFKTTAKLMTNPLFQDKNIVDAKTVAEFGYRAMMKGKTVAIYGFSNRALAFLVRFVPRKVVTAFARKKMRET